MIKIETRVGKLKISIEADSVADVFDSLKEIQEEYLKKGIGENELVQLSEESQNISYPTNAINNNTAVPNLSSVSQVASVREPEKSIEEINGLISTDKNGEIVPLFPKGLFKAKELAVCYFYARYLAGQTTNLKELSDFLTKEGINQGAKDNMMSGLRKSRVIIQKEGQIELINVPFVRKTISKMVSKAKSAK
jgi:hypothetical protein